jgi:hypothetical protein
LNFDKANVEKLSDGSLDEIRLASVELKNLQKRVNAIREDHGWMIDFFSKLNMRGDNECWEWTGSRSAFGHGSFNMSGLSSSNSHRIMYKLTKGPIPTGMFVCHSCDNPPCCNPAHLWLGTPKDNMADCVSKGRFKATPPPLHMRARGEQSARSKLNNEQVTDIFLSNDSTKILADKYGIGMNSIRYIKTGVTWAHVTSLLNIEGVSEHTIH